MKLLISKELQGQEKEESDLTPLSVGSSLQTLHYYENPGILMIVQSVDIEEGKLSLGSATSQIVITQESVCIIDRIESFPRINLLLDVNIANYRL